MFLLKYPKPLLLSTSYLKYFFCLIPQKVLSTTILPNIPINTLSLSENSLKRLEKKNIENFYPLQVEAFTPIKSGLDFIGKSKTGTGKTLAFILPLIERFRTEFSVSFHPKILVISPTRELANQITQEFQFYGPELRIAPCYGGVSIYNQIRNLERKCDVIVATPGRLMDLMNRNVLPTTDLQVLVIDEADHMLDIGFKEDLDYIIKKLSSKQLVQKLMFSATIPQWINKTVKNYMNKDLVYIDAVGNENQTASQIRHIAMPCDLNQISNSLGEIIRVYSESGRTLIFTRTKKFVDELMYSQKNNIEIGSIHGDISQISRELVLKNFKSGKINCLIATDVAARGLDIQNVDLVIQLGAPQTVDYYIHRCGRSARAGKQGVSILLYNPKEEWKILKEIEMKANFSFEKKAMNFIEKTENESPEIQFKRIFIEGTRSTLSGSLNTVSLLIKDYSIDLKNQLQSIVFKYGNIEMFTSKNKDKIVFDIKLNSLKNICSDLKTMNIEFLINAILEEKEFFTNSNSKYDSRNKRRPMRNREYMNYNERENYDSY